MKRYLSYLITLLISLGVFSCTDDNGDNCKPTPAEDGEVTRTFTLQLPSLIESPSSYGMTTAAENAIHTLDILAFEIGHNNKETFAYHVQATSIEDAGPNPRYKKATVKLKVSDNPYRFVFLSNVSDEIEALIPIAQTGEKDLVLARLLHGCEAERQWTTAEHYFPMWGESDELTITEDTELDENIEMVRSLARIDILNEAGNFELEGAYLYKYHCLGHVVPDPAHMSGTKAHTPTIPADSVIATRSLLHETDQNQFVQELYTYESRLNAGHYDKTCLVIGGRYYPADFKAGDTEPETTWYRIEFVDDNDKDIHLLRNHCYIFQIKSVKGEGYTDPDEAYQAKPFNVDVDVLPWDQGSMTDFVYNGQYFLGVSESEIYMPAPEDTVSILVTTNYKTDYAQGWTATFESIDKDGKEWLTHYDGAFTDINKKDPLIFHLTENKDAAMRTGKVHLRAGVLRHTIYVYQDIADEEVIWLNNVGEDNCYILHPDGNGVRIPVSQANKDKTIRIGAIDVLEAEVLWTDTPYPVGDANCVIRSVSVSGTGSNGYLEVIANKVWGNALVAVKVNGTIRWSWHIWVCEYDPAESAYHYTNGNWDLIIMDRNIGALSNESDNPKSIGSTYQWGRKDPFPGASDFNSTVPFTIYDKEGNPKNIIYTPAVGQSILEASIEQPVTYIQGAGTYNNWYGTEWNSRREDLLEDFEGDVSPYDPCPDGWTMNLERSFWDYMNSGFTFVNEPGGISCELGFWPTAGNRNHTGAFVSQTGIGYYWLGSSNYGDANAVKIDQSRSPQKMDIGMPTTKSSGLSIRCIKH